VIVTKRNKEEVDEDECQEPHHENNKIMIKRNKQEGNGDEHQESKLGD
jgi:hypothetical protein